MDPPRKPWEDYGGSVTIRKRLTQLHGESGIHAKDIRLRYHIWSFIMRSIRAPPTILTNPALGYRGRSMRKCEHIKFSVAELRSVLDDVSSVVMSRLVSNCNSNCHKAQARWLAANSIGLSDDFRPQALSGGGGDGSSSRIARRDLENSRIIVHVRHWLDLTGRLPSVVPPIEVSMRLSPSSIARRASRSVSSLRSLGATKPRSWAFEWGESRRWIHRVVIKY